MSNKEILEKAIPKAIDCGWKEINGQKILHFRNASDKYIKLQTNDDGMVGGEHFEVYTVIFNHDFAKALWGEEWKSAEILEQIPEKDSYRVGTVLPCWQFHLQNMVIAEDPIKYLGENI